MKTVAGIAPLRTLGLQEEELRKTKLGPFFNNPLETGSVGKEGDSEGNIRSTLAAHQLNTLDPDQAGSSIHALDHGVPTTSFPVKQQDWGAGVESMSAEVALLIGTKGNQIPGLKWVRVIER